MNKQEMPSGTVAVQSGAEPETIDRGCPVQINRMFGLNFFLLYDIYFSVNRVGALAPTLVPPLCAVIPIEKGI
jgi:hypothetical protein